MDDLAAFRKSNDCFLQIERKAKSN